MTSAMCCATLRECTAASGDGGGRFGSTAAIPNSLGRMAMVIETFGLHCESFFEFPADYSMQEQAILITGAARRIGAATARALHAAGARIVLHCHRSRDEAEALADELNETRDESCGIVQADLV